MGALEILLGVLVDGEPLPERCKEHPLTGDWASHRECHVEPDWLLIYKLLENGSKVRFERTGTHSDLFR